MMCVRGAAQCGSCWESQHGHADSSLSTHGSARVDLRSWAALLSPREPQLRERALASWPARHRGRLFPWRCSFIPGCCLAGPDGRPRLSQSDAGVPSRRRPIRGHHLLETRNPLGKSNNKSLSLQTNVKCLCRLFLFLILLL